MVLNRIKKQIEERRENKNPFWKSLVFAKDSLWYIINPLAASEDIGIGVSQAIFKQRYKLKKGKLPDFLIIGAQKSGTSSLWYHLKQHPQIEMAPYFWGKEIHFFDVEKRWNKGTTWYRAFFRNNNKLQGEATPAYMFSKKSLSRISKTVPKAKLILILRDPVKRAYSNYQMLRLHDYTNLSFKENFLSNKLILQRGIYIKQINNLLKYFRKDQILILISEKMRKNPQKTYNKVFDFLGIKKVRINHKPGIHEGNYPRMNKEDKNKLIDFYKPYNEKLFDFLGIRVPEWRMAKE